MQKLPGDTDACETKRGGYMDIGGSTGGGSRRVIDDWAPPDIEEFLEQAETVGGFVRRVSPKKR